MTYLWRTRATAHTLGDDVPHDGGIMTRAMVSGRVTDPEQLIPHLFEDHQPVLMRKLVSGDFLIAGRNFGCGKPHTNGYIALRALGIRVLCESAPGIVTRATVNLGLPCLWRCEGITSVVNDGDEIEVDFTSGTLTNHSTGKVHHYPAMSERDRVMIEQGGRSGFLRHYLASHPELGEPEASAATAGRSADAAPRTIPIQPMPDA